MNSPGGAPRWDLTPLFSGLDDRSFTSAMEGVFADVDRLAALYDRHDVRAVASRPVADTDIAAIDDVLTATNELHERLRPVRTYLHLLATTDSRNDRAAALNVELQTRTTALGPLSARFDAWIASLGAQPFVDRSAEAAAHAFALEMAVEDARFQMTEAEEALAAELGPSGAAAWQRLHGDVSSQLSVEVQTADGSVERLPMAMVRALATHPDADRRRLAYEGELAAWPTVSVPLAAAMNGAKGEQGVLNRRRRYGDDLEPALQMNRVDRATLDAMTEAVVASLPDFRRYLRVKARLLGHEGGLPWWDLFAPVGRAGRVEWDDATQLVGHAFGAFSPRLGGLAQRAFDERWVDAEIRDGKRGGAYCAGVGRDVSRIMMNFDGSVDSVFTLAHELGHAYHNVASAERTPMQRHLPMALAETASIFCETLLFEAAVVRATDATERLALLDTHLVGATQVVVDIHSRFLFETELCRRRRRTALSANELNEMMLDAQETAYGDGLHPDHRHPYMWAVKPHYFVPFYNWPYTFGLLFGIGLFARYRDDPDRFCPGYDDLLGATGMADAATLAAGFDIDVRDRAFWASSLAVLLGHIDEYERLAQA